MSFIFVFQSDFFYIVFIQVNRIVIGKLIP